MGGDILEWMIDRIFPWLMILGIIALVVIVALLPFSLYAEYKAEKFSLKKDDWACSASVERASTTYVQSGNVMVPLTTYSKHCTQWTEKP